jgi:hypothetical protein
MCKKSNAIWLSFALFFPLVFQAQVFVNDSFGDGNFTSSPAWFGDTQKFEVNPSNQLQINDANDDSPAYLVTSSNIINQASWEFWLRMEFAPSGSNYGIIYLVSDNQNLTQNLNGYFVQIGGVSGTVDDVSLFRQDGNSSTKLIDGVDGTVGLDPVDVKVKVTKDSAGEWELFIDTSAAKNNYVSQGAASDLSHAQCSYFGVLCTYTSTRSDKFFFDDISLQGEAFQDTLKPILSSLTVIDSNSLQLNFSENVQLNSALSPSNYRVNKGFGSPQMVSFVGNDSSLVQLDFSNPFNNAEAYFLKVENVQDRSSNVMETDSLPFLYFQSIPATYRDLVINEFYPDFTPSQGLPSAEFVEIYNASNKVFDLANWSFTDGTSTTSLISHILRPGDYLILCAQADENDFTPYGDVLGLSSLPTLNNSGDLIQLSDANNQVVDELSYDEGWYQDENKTTGGWTIEQINPLTNCTGASNFRASTANIGGTPGTQNSIFDTLPDITPPKLLRAAVLSVDSILLYFNERLDTNSVLSASYQFNTNVILNQIVNREPDFSSVLLTLSNGLDSGLVNTVTVNGISDCPGNLIGNDNVIDMVVPALPKYRDVVINEIYADFSPVVALPEAEFIELYNASDQVFDLSNWKLSDGSTVSTLQSRIFMPGDYVIICPAANATAFETFGLTQGQSAFPSLRNSGDEIFIRAPNNYLVDYVKYDDSWYQNESKRSGGWTLEQINPQLSCSGEYNFKASENKLGGTPGTQNSIFDDSPDTQAPVLVDVLVYAADTIQLIFNEGIDNPSVLKTNITFSNGIQVDTVLFNALQNNLVTTVLNPVLDSGELVTLSLSGIEDCSENVISTSTNFNLALPQLARFKDVVINEILFNPRNEGSDFVELYNRSNKIISLQNWQLGNKDNGQINTISEQPYLLFPGEYVFITENGINIQQEYPETKMDRLLEVDQLASLNNDGGIPFIVNAKGEQIDEIRYHEDMHFELLRDEKGVSLERINPNGASDGTNFHSAAESVNFATPAYQNSQYSLSTIFKGDVNIDPETFSPDNDGYQDLLNINYQFPEPGNVANVRIYDRKGRLIRDLINNELLGLKGTFKWDGITEDNNKARIGVYLIYFEVFNPNGEQKVYKKTAVLAGFLD